METAQRDRGKIIIKVGDRVRMRDSASGSTRRRVRDSASECGILVDESLWFVGTVTDVGPPIRARGRASPTVHGASDFCLGWPSDFVWDEVQGEEHRALNFGKV